jgi:hypothetical protein
VIHWLIIFTFDASLGANFCGEIHDLSDLVWLDRKELAFYSVAYPWIKGTKAFVDNISKPPCEWDSCSFAHWPPCNGEQFDIHQ